MEARRVNVALPVEGLVSPASEQNSNLPVKIDFVFEADQRSIFAPEEL